MTGEMVLISDLGVESRAAFVEDGVLQRLVVSQSDDGPRAGDIILGRIVKVAAHIDAAFVDLGLERDGFLGHAEARLAHSSGGRIGEFVSEGDAVLVQILQEAIGGKGPKVTARPALPGRSLVLLPGQPGVRLSRRIDDANLRTRLADAVDALATDEAGWIVRSIAARLPLEAITAEARRLLEIWSDVKTRRSTARPPRRLRRGPDAVLAALIEESSRPFERVVADTSERLAELRGVLPDLAEHAEFHSGTRPLFDAYGIEEQIQALMQPRAALPSGGMIEIAETAAVVAIDVDTGTASLGGAEDTALRVNLEAADAVARQIRLRDLAGHIVIDFVPMRNRGNRARLVTTLRHALERDGRPVQLAGYTALGLVELTRMRRGRPLRRRLMTACPACRGYGRIPSPTAVAHEALRRILTEARVGAAPAWRITASPAVVAALRQDAAASLSEVERRLGLSVVVREHAALAPDAYDVSAVRPGEE